jgi:hypothetical protein
MRGRKGRGLGEGRGKDEKRREICKISNIFPG